MNPYYSASQAPRLEDATFQTPPADCGGVPFWSWNGVLERQQLLTQVDDQIAMGMGAVQPHSRIGLQTPYLGAEWFGHVKAVTEHAKTRGRRVWIYDEDRWPSGYAGGLATKETWTRAQFLRFTKNGDLKSLQAQDSGNEWRRRTGEGKLLARYEVSTNDQGQVLSYRRLNQDEANKPGIWYAFEESVKESPWFNGTAYLDTLNPAAVRKFLEVTHERYAQELGSEMGKTVAAFFTDEPALTCMRSLSTPEGLKTDGIVAWTGDLAQTFQHFSGIDILDRVPELFLDRADGAHAQVRWTYFDHLADRFRRAFHQQIGDWCEQHGVAMSGHLMAEDSLQSQHHWLAEAMRHYRHYHIPGIDNLCDLYQPITAKQAQSVARQDGRNAVMSELYGVTDWNFGADGHLYQGNWQAALGITVRVHHLAWYTMAGHAKRDYPASIDRRLPWWTEYKTSIEDHFSRLNTVLTRGRPLCRVAVLHPVESVWVLAGPNSSSTTAMKDLENSFNQVVLSLLHGQIDCDLLAESLLPEQSVVKSSSTLQVGAMAYQAIVLPPMTTIRSTTLDRLEAFAKAGGYIVLVGEAPRLVDGLPSDRAAKLQTKRVPLSNAQILESLGEYRDLQVVSADGGDNNDCIYQMREDGVDRQVFVACVRNPKKDSGQAMPWSRLPIDRTLRFKGTWQVTHNDTVNGNRQPVKVRHVNGWTEVPWKMQATASACLTLTPTKNLQREESPKQLVWKQETSLSDPQKLERDEANVLLLSLAQLRIPGGNWSPRQEIGRAEDALRQQLGLPGRRGQRPQPWSLPPAQRFQPVEVRYTLESAIPLSGLRLACEDSPEVILNGKLLTTKEDGFWIDPCLKTRLLPDLPAGRHEIILRSTMTEYSTLEWSYILGEFGVEVSGSHARLIPQRQEISWGSLTTQGFAFYGGNATYSTNFTTQGGKLRLAIPWYGAPLLAVEIDGVRVGLITGQPHRLDLGEVSAGQHQLRITAFGHRRNHLGAVHCLDPACHWWGPDTFERTNDTGVEEWQLVPTGILTRPCIERAE